MCNARREIQYYEMTYKDITKPGIVMHTGNPSSQEAKMKKKRELESILS